MPLAVDNPIHRHRRILAPGDRDSLIQVIDVRDLADWMVHCLEQQVTGVYNAVGYQGDVSMQELLHGCKCATSTPASFVWASEEFLLEQGVGPWMDMPLWIPRDSNSYAVNDRAIAAGLLFRPPGDSIRDTLAWARTERGEQPFRRTGLRPARERQLLEKWKAQRDR